jgi:hypothetical protein
MAVHKVKKNRFVLPVSKPFKVTNTDRETVASLGAKLRTALADIQDLKERVRDLEVTVEQLDQ